MKRVFTGGGIIKYISDKKGVTLTEVMVSLVILSIVAVPFLDAFISAAKNNALSRDKLITSTKMQEAMEDLKSRSQTFLDMQAITFKTGHPGFLEDYSLIDTVDAAGADDEKVKVKYRIDEQSRWSETDNPDYSTEYTFNSKNIDYSLEFAVYQEHVSLAGSTYKLNGDLTIAPENEQGTYGYSFLDSDNKQKSADFTTQGDINIKIKFDSSRTEQAGAFELGVVLDGNLNRKVNFYIINSKSPSELNLVNEGNIPFTSFYDVLSSDNSGAKPVSNHIVVLYRIQVNAYKQVGQDGNPSEYQLLNSVVSYVQKAMDVIN